MTLRPIWKKRDPITGDWIFGLRQEDLDLVAQRYACHVCLEEFREAGMRAQMDVCPVCRREQERAADYGIIVPTPAGW